MARVLSFGAVRKLNKNGASLDRNRPLTWVELRVSSLRTCEWGVSGHRNISTSRPNGDRGLWLWRVSGHRNGLAGTVGGCRRHVLSSLLCHRGPPSGEVARAYGVSRAGCPGWSPDTGPRARRRSSHGRGGRRARRTRSATALRADHPACGRSWRGRAWTPGRTPSAGTCSTSTASRVSAATVSRYLTRHGLVTPEPKKRPKSSCLRFAAELPNECWQSDFTHYPLADGTDSRDPGLAR